MSLPPPTHPYPHTPTPKDNTKARPGKSLALRLLNSPTHPLSSWMSIYLEGPYTPDVQTAQTASGVSIMTSVMDESGMLARSFTSLTASASEASK